MIATSHQPGCQCLQCLAVVTADHPSSCDCAVCEVVSALLLFDVKALTSP